MAKLVETGLLDSPIEEAFDRLTSLAARTIRAPVSLVSLVTEERQFFKSVFGLPEPWASRRETPLTHSFCRHVVSTASPLIIRDSREHPLVHHNLAVRDLRVIAYAGFPLALRSGEVLGSFCVIDSKPRDWSDEEVALLRDLARSVVTEIELRLSMQTRQELLDLVFHDLKNPLSAVLMNAQVLATQAKRNQNSESLRFVTRISASGDRMHKIIDNISDLTRIENGQLELEVSTTSAGQILDEVQRVLQPEIDARGYRLEKRSFDEVILRCDPSRMSRVMMCVLDALMDLSGEERRIILSAEGHALVVRYPSALIPPDQLGHIFERFWKLDCFKSKGTKLGLVLARELVALHNGCIQVSSARNEGTVFRIQLP